MGARILSYGVLGMGALIFMGPVALMVGVSLSSRGLAPGDLTLGNYISVFEQLDFVHFLVNSIFIVGTIVAAGLVVNSMAGYALSRLQWVGRRAVLALVLSVLIIPCEVVAVPLFFEMTLLGWENTFRAQIIPFIANPFAIYLFYTFFNTLPKELDEAARMDGAGPFQIYFHIILPLSLPAFASVAVLTFLLHWGFFLWPLMVTHGPDCQPLPVALGYFSANKPVQWGQIMAFCTLMVLPVLLVFLIFQKGFVRGIGMAGIKG